MVKWRSLRYKWTRFQWRPQGRLVLIIARLLVSKTLVCPFYRVCSNIFPCLILSEELWDTHILLCIYTHLGISNLSVGILARKYSICFSLVWGYIESLSGKYTLIHIYYIYFKTYFIFIRIYLMVLGTDNIVPSSLSSFFFLWCWCWKLNPGPC